MRRHCSGLLNFDGMMAINASIKLHAGDCGYASEALVKDQEFARLVKGQVNLDNHIHELKDIILYRHHGSKFVKVCKLSS